MKTVLITGGSGGIGSAVAREFAKRGYAVAFTYRKNKSSAEKLQAELSQTVPCLALQADLSQAVDVEKAKAQFFATFTHADVLVNCAGISRSGLLQDMTEKDYYEVTDADLKSAFLVTKAMLPTLLDRGGAIVNVSSVWGVTGGSCEVLYSTAKAGLIGMTKALAKEVAPMGVRVNAVAPGFVDTPMNACYSEEEREAFLSALPISRAGTPEEIAQAVVFLAEAQYVTGQVLSVDGGYCI